MNLAHQSDFEQHRTNSLFLLVGRNPLPNYVAASLLLEPGGVLYLLHSTKSQQAQGTGEVAQRLASHFPAHRPQLIAVDARDTAGLRSRVQEYLESAPPGRVGLNYTGGTKVMAVHAYQAIECFCHEHRREAVFSYLDADTLEMSIEARAGQPALRRPVARGVQLTLKDIFDLHGVRLRGRLQTDPVLPGLARALAQMHADDVAGVLAWRESRQVLNTCDGRPWQEVQADLVTCGATPDVMERLGPILGVHGPEPINQRAVARQAGFESWQELWLWLQGVWLEHWTLACIEELGYEQRARSLEKQAGNQFEIDVAVMQGYQLFALSCSAGDKHGRLKLKLFEIYTRARQLGGDEARVGLVCAAEEPHDLQREIIREWDTGRRRVRVFGRQDLIELKERLQTWFESV